MRLYDIRAQKKPILVTKIEESPVMNLCLSGDDKHCLISNQTGTISVLDTRKDLQMIHVLWGAKGSLKSLKSYDDYVVGVGLDRFLWIFNFKTKETVVNVYLKQKQMSLLIDGTKDVDLSKKEEIPEETKTKKSSKRVKKS